jgi:hypothetical protein
LLVLFIVVSDLVYEFLDGPSFWGRGEGRGRTLKIFSPGPEPLLGFPACKSLIAELLGVEFIRASVRHDFLSAVFTSVACSE